MHRSNETSFDHLVGDACKVDGTGAVQLWTGASWADIPERYGSHTLTASSEGAGSGFGTAFWNRRQGLRRLDVYLSLEPWLHGSTKPKIRSFAIAYTPAQIARKERERLNQFR
jgi:hypothetical protein